ncbi:arylsulfotransferase family protein, partial [bacterium]|nr:arylsulfotransferase family protein [bacterium]
GEPETSKVIEFDPATGEIIWQYGTAPEEHFFTEQIGSCQRLPNNNVLITESEPGRAFEVTLDKTIVWEYYNPYRAGENDEFIATLLEVVRLPSDFPQDWIEG